MTLRSVTFKGHFSYWKFFRINNSRNLSFMNPIPSYQRSIFLVLMHRNYISTTITTTTTLTATTAVIIYNIAIISELLRAFFTRLTNIEQCKATAFRSPWIRSVLRRGVVGPANTLSIGRTLFRLRRRHLAAVAVCAEDHCRPSERERDSKVIWLLDIAWQHRCCPRDCLRPQKFDKICWRWH